MLDEASPVVTLFDCAAVLEPLLVLPAVAVPPLPASESAVPSGLGWREAVRQPLASVAAAAMPMNSNPTRCFFISPSADWIQKIVEAC